MLCHHQIYSKLLYESWSSRLSTRRRFIGQKFRVWVTSIHHIYFPSSHLPLFVPPKGEHSSFIFRDSGWCYLSICTIFSPLLLMGKMSQNKGTKSLYYIQIHIKHSNISAKSLQTPGLSALCCWPFKRKNTEMKRGGGQKTTSVKYELQIRLTKG